MSVEITPALLSDLRQKAEAATQGPWNQQGLASLLRFAQKHDGPWNDDEYIDCTLQLPEEKDADYIAAASPAVVLALINQLDWQTAQHIEEIKNCIDLQKIIDDLKKEIEDLKDRCDC